MSESWKIVGDLCRCCHSQGSSFPSLSVSCLEWDGGLVYSDMMKICFDINLPQVQGPLGALTFTICEECTIKLKDASTFKKQVLKCEERFMDSYNRNVIVADIGSLEGLEVKKENQGSYIEDGKENSDEIEDRLGGEDIEEAVSDTKLAIEIKVEHLEDTTRKRGRKPKLKQGKKRLKKKEIDRSDTEVEIRRNDRNRKKFHMQPTDYKIIDKDYICLHCGKKYTKKVSLRYHVKAKHYRVPLFRCYVCSKEFMTMAPLTVHKLEEHAIDERYKCNACPSSFNTSVQLRKHKNNFHMLGERHKCEFCDYESFSFESLYKHKFKHKTVKDFLCRFCRKPFLRKATLDLHERIHTGDRRKVCKVCGQAFVQKASLNYHMTKYHPEVNF